MRQKLLLVDFENVQQVDLARLDGGIQVIIFVGSGQKTIPIELVTASQALGERVKWQRVEGNGSNALDFHIACHLGRVLERSPQINGIVKNIEQGEIDRIINFLVEKKLITESNNTVTYRF